MAGPVYPDVPKEKGVPQVKRSVDNPGTATQDQLASDSITVTATARNQWGVYTAGNVLALKPDNIVALGYSAEHRVADYPIEEGGFETYDKVALPFDIRVIMTKGGAVEDRREFLNAVDNLRGDTELYNVVTPERAYLNCNFTRVSVDRSREQGAGLVTVELHLREIRQSATATFSKTADPASADTASKGSVQAKETDKVAQQKVSDKSAVTAALAHSNGSVSAVPFYSTTSGKSLLQIPTSALSAAQSFTTQLAGQSVLVTLLQKRTGLFADVVVAGQAIAQGVLCRDGVPLINGAARALTGDLAFFDMQGGADPDYTALGSRFQLFWAG